MGQPFIYSITDEWMVYVFDSDGHIVQHNTISAFTDFVPKSIISISPLRIGFGYRHSAKVEAIADLDHTEEQWAELMKRELINESQRYTKEQLADHISKIIKWDSYIKSLPPEARKYD